MRVLIVGVGSIAKKHIQAILTLDSKAEIYGLRSSKESTKIDQVINVYDWNKIPTLLDFVIISNPTSEHHESILKAAVLGVPLFIEKPALHSLHDSDEIVNILNQNKIMSYVAFPLRFNPVIQWLKEKIDNTRVLEMSAYCGSYLPEWRPGQDYTKTYSAIKNLGGGVHLDLIHELDYVTWLLGEPLKSSAFFSKVSDLDIDTYDSAHYWLTYPDKNTSVSLNYYRRDPKRELTIAMDTDTWTADLLTNEIKNHMGEVIFRAAPSSQHMYFDQISYFTECIRTGKKPMNSLAESLKVVEIALSNNNER